MDSGIKYWIGNLARTASYGVVFANLIINNTSYGVHSFIITIRDSQGMIKQGLELGDCGPKLGMQGIDNGWC